MLDFTPLAKVIQTLASAMLETAGHPGDLLARDGCMQRFEYSYELRVKSLRRKLQDIADVPDGIDAWATKTCCVLPWNAA